MSDSNEFSYKILRALFWCKPCSSGYHSDCEAPCACSIHKPSGKVNPYLEGFGKNAVIFTDEQREQIKKHLAEEDA